MCALHGLSGRRTVASVPHRTWMRRDRAGADGDLRIRWMWVSNGSSASVNTECAVPVDADTLYVGWAPESAPGPRKGLRPSRIAFRRAVDDCLPPGPADTRSAGRWSHVRRRTAES